MERWSTWQITKVGERFYLRRHRLPVASAKEWSSYKGNYNPASREAVEAVRRRLNATYEQKKREAESRYDFDHSYMSVAMVEDFIKQRSHHIVDKSHLKNIRSVLQKHIFEFFILQKQMPDPSSWSKVQYELGEKMVKKGYSLSSIQRVQIVANQYLEFLHKRFPDQVLKYEIELLAPAKRKMIEAKEELDDDTRGQLVSEEHYRLLLRYGRELQSHIVLAWKFGLRRAEVLGLQVSDVRKTHIAVRQQLSAHNDRETKYEPLKGRYTRKTPYWFSSPQEAYDLINGLKLMHPDTLTHKFDDLIRLVNEKEKLSLTYTFHDFRHSFITLALRNRRAFGIEISDVSDAVGHKDERTTQQYREDDRNLDDDIWMPQ